MADRMTLTFRDARIIFRNFAGREGPYNQAGDRSFGVIIPDEDVAQQMVADGWNVKYPKVREDADEGDPFLPHLPVAVKFGVMPPKITLITSNARTHITEDMAEMLDGVDIAKVDLMVNASNWVVNGKSGVKAYLKTMFITINEDELELEYAEDHFPEGGD